MMMKKKIENEQKEYKGVKIKYLFIKKIIK